MVLHGGLPAIAAAPASGLSATGGQHHDPPDTYLVDRPERVGYQQGGRALAVEPQVMLLDELFGALDAKVRKELRDWLRLHDEVHVTTVFVTHDQEEASGGCRRDRRDQQRRRRAGRLPDYLYDHPVNDFVMSFLSPVTTLTGKLVRPHDLEILTAPEHGSVPVTIARVVRLGFEVRIDGLAGGHDVWIQATKGQVDRLGLHPGIDIYVRPVTNAV